MPTLVPFGPTKPIPKGYRHCFACDGDGIGYDHEADCEKPCEPCAGKGYHNADDIEAYHKTAPELCRSVCGPQHVRSSDKSWEEIDASLNKALDAMDVAKDILRKHGKL